MYEESDKMTQKVLEVKKLTNFVVLSRGIQIFRKKDEDLISSPFFI